VKYCLRWDDEPWHPYMCHAGNLDGYRVQEAPEISEYGTAYGTGYGNLRAKIIQEK
jgi:hypothetical protein